MIKYQTAVDRGRTAVRAQGSAAWKLGDIASTVEAAYGENTHAKLADDIGIAYKTLINYRTVSEAYPPAQRSDVNSYSVHEIFAPLDDRAELVAEKTWTTREARELVRSRDDAMSPLERAQAKVAKLEAQLIKARAELAKLEAEATPKATAPKAKATAPKAKATAPKATAPKATAPKATAPKATAGRPALHVVKGIPQHAPEDCTPACSLHRNESARRVRHARKTA